MLAKITIASPPRGDREGWGRSGDGMEMGIGVGLGLRELLPSQKHWLRELFPWAQDQGHCLHGFWHWADAGYEDIKESMASFYSVCLHGGGWCCASSDKCLLNVPGDCSSLFPWLLILKISKWGKK